MKEIWKPISNTNNYYEVSTTGKIRSYIGIKRDKLGRLTGKKIRCSLPKIIKPQFNHNGYLTIKISFSSGIKRIPIHRLVAEAFIPNPENKPQVNHIDGIKNNNYYKNLEWVTQRENSIHSFKIGLQCNKGNNHSQNILTKKDVLLIRTLPPLGFTQTSIANAYGVTPQQIHNIIHHKSWSHL